MELHLVRDDELAPGAWRLMPRAATSVSSSNQHLERDVGKAKVFYQVVPLKMVPLRVSKYDLCLREQSLRATQAMHAILSKMVLFFCGDCKERFPTFHPAYAPPLSLVDSMTLLKRGRDHLAPCDVQVFRWDELPPLDSVDGAAEPYGGTCYRCQHDMDEQVRKRGDEEAHTDVVALRSEDNHMDPCFRFPAEELQELFDGATLVESMLVALQHMVVTFITVGKSGLRKFRRNTISFLQDIAGFAQRHELFKYYSPQDRVDSSRGPGRDLDRPVRKAIEATPQELETFAVGAAGSLIFPATVVEVLQDGTLVLRYDHGGEGLELPEQVRPRMRMP